MNLGSFFTVQHAVRAFTSSHPASMCLSLFTLHPFPCFDSFPFIPPALASWFPSPSAGPDDEFPLHTAQAALTRRRVCADAGHLALLTRYSENLSIHMNTHTHTASCFTSCVCVCVCVFIHRSPRRDTSQCDRPQPGNSSSHPEDLHRDQAVRAK